MRKIKKIIVHCSDSPDDLDIGAKEIRKWHVSKPPHGRGWSDIGYHFVIRQDGTRESGRPVNEAGAHVRGQNKDSIGICLVGRKSFSDEQINSLKKLVKDLLLVYDRRYWDVYGHYEFDSKKTCPNIDMRDFRLSLII